MNSVEIFNPLTKKALKRQNNDTGLKIGRDDLLNSFSKWKLWCFLAWNDIRMRYRGSVLGPFWITLNMIIFVCIFSIVYSRLFHQSLKDYVPFLTAGYVVWLLISSVLLDSCSVYLEAATFIKEIRLPYLMFILRILCRNIIVFSHNLIVFLFVALFFKVPMGWQVILLIPGLLLVAINLFSIGLIFSIFGGKYRDITQIIASLVQVLFFVTPITWSPSLLNNSLIVKLNPLNNLIDLIRLPLLGQIPTFNSWISSISMAGVLFIISIALFSRFRRQIPFWI